MVHVDVRDLFFTWNLWPGILENCFLLVVKEKRKRNGSGAITLLVVTNTKLKRQSEEKLLLLGNIENNKLADCPGHPNVENVLRILFWRPQVVHEDDNLKQNQAQGGQNEYLYLGFQALKTAYSVDHETLFLA